MLKGPFSNLINNFKMSFDKPHQKSYSSTLIASINAQHHCYYIKLHSSLYRYFLACTGQKLVSSASACQPA